jgi:hypothetical protein
VVIVARRAGLTLERTAAEWVAELGPVPIPTAGPDGVILGPERVRVKVTRHQKALSFSGDLLGWVEVYGKATRGSMTLYGSLLRFEPDHGGHVIEWSPGDLTGLQPASASLQLGSHQQMTSVKFEDGSVRLWTKALSSVVSEHWARLGFEVVELQPVVRTRVVAGGIQ